MVQLNLTMTLTKSTKGTHVYGAGAKSAIPSLYIKKINLPSSPPETIIVKVEY